MPSMLCAIDGSRCVIEPVVEANAVEAGEPSAVSEAHVPFLTADGSFTTHQAVSLPGPERAIAYAHGDPLVLEGTSLVDVGTAMVELVLVHGDCGALLRCRCLLRSGLSEANGRGQCENPDANEREFHGVSPGGGGFYLLLWPFRAHVLEDTGWE